MPRQFLEAFNVLLGQIGFVALTLPSPWRITRATVTPEVNTTVREGERQWVASGETRHVVLEQSRNLRAHLLVRVAPGKARRPLSRLNEAVEDGTITIGGHPGVFQIGRRREGILPRRLVPTAQVRHYCDRTRRTILMDVSGAVAVEDLRRLVEALGGLECHGVG